MILVGEKHGIKENFDIYLDWIKKCNRKESVVVLFETSYSSGIYINEYIHGNEIFPIQEWIKDYQGTMLGSMEFMNFVIRLKKYQQRAKHKLMFYGIDLEYQKTITKRMLQYTKENKREWIHHAIKLNQQHTNKISSLAEEQYEKEREKYLSQSFHIIESSCHCKNILCFMGAWHVKENVNEKNFVKMIRKKKKSLLSLEIAYFNSMRTIKKGNHFVKSKINDIVDWNQYQRIGNIGISHSNESSGIIMQNEGHFLEMIPI